LSQIISARDIAVDLGRAGQVAKKLPSGGGYDLRLIRWTSQFPNG
jgi:hypothetical protein